MKMLMDTLTVCRYVVDNRYVVPYNVHLLKKYRAHINIEACASVKSVKYLFNPLNPIIAELISVTTLP